jgi:acylphosphatase
MAKIRVLITGKVQGVFFRQSASREAKKLNISGWIKNLPDGSVLSEAIGPENLLSDFIFWCKKGPQRAEVTNTTVEWLNTEEDIPSIKQFDIID